MFSMGIRLKLNLVLLFVAAVGVALYALISGPFLSELAREEVLVRARIMIESAAGIRKYTSEEIAPLLYSRVDDKFYVQTVASYAALKNLSELHKEFPEYSYREAALNPMNLANRATESEADIIREFRNSPDKKELLTERQTHNGLVMYLSRPLVATQNCLVCHDTPERAPPAMVAQYGKTNGFGWKPNEVIGARIVSIPLAAPLASASKALNLSLYLLGAVFVILILLINLLVEFLIIRPVVRMSRVASDVSLGKENVEEYVKRGSDEVANLSHSINRMKRSVEEAVRLLTAATK